MNEFDAKKLEAAILDHQRERFTADNIRHLSQVFRRHGFIKVPDIVPPEVRSAVRSEALDLLRDNAERRDLKLATTDDSPRKMSVVRSEVIAANSTLIPALASSRAVLDFLETLGRSKMFPSPSKDEEYLITRHEKRGDTHGWHWGDYSFALIWILETPPMEYGGLLQCVPHTDWDKSDARIYQYLCENQISTYSFVTGDIYFLRTDTTLHRTIPLNRDAVRIILNMTWASDVDMSRQLVGQDRWWENAQAKAAVQTTSAAEAGG